MKQQARITSPGLWGRTGRFSVLAVLLLMAVAWGAVPAVSSAAITPAVTPSRTTGVAPLYVLFDAWATTADSTTRPAHDLLFEWDFADSGSGTWATDGESRNTAKGPEAAHVFETPGTYSVSLIVSDGSGGVASTTVQIVVSDPNTVFSGTNTICFSTTSDFTGAPTGSQHVTATDVNTINTYVATGKRLLLHRGQTWSASGTLSIGPAGPGTVGAFGTGTAPLLRATSGFYPFIMPSGSDWRIMDLEIDGQCATYPNSRGINAGANISQLLVLRLNIHDVNVGVSANGDTIAIVDSTLMHGDASSYMCYSSALEFALLGTVMNDTVAGFHVLRMPCCNRAVIGHNNMGMQGATMHVLKIHAPEWGTPFLGYSYSERIVISDNTFTGDSNWTVACGPQNDTTDERVRDVIIERNFFPYNAAVSVGLEICGQEFTVRNNIFSGATINIGQRALEPPPLNCRVYNNTGYSPNAAQWGLTLATLGANTDSTTIRNNLLSSPVGTLTIYSGGTNTVADHNLATASPGFVSSSPVNAADFALAAGSAAINAGTTVPVWDDYTGADRPVGTPDDGAYEYGATGNHPPVANNDSYSTPMNTAINQSAPGVLGNDTDADGDTLTASLVTNVSHGTLTLNSNGSFTYTPTTGYTGSDSFVYKAYDGTAYSANATVALTVTSSGDVLTGLVSRWTFDNSGNIGADSVGSNNGTGTNATYTASGKIAGAVSFAGNGYISVPYSTTLALNRMFPPNHRVHFTLKPCVFSAVCAFPGVSS